MPERTNLNRVERFHRNKHRIPDVIRSRIDNHEIVYGERALNERFPPHLDRPTQDYDIYSPTPKKDAKETEAALDKEFGGDHFYVESAQHKGTFKIKSHVNQEGYADYTKPEGFIPTEEINGLRVVRLSFVKDRIKKTLANPESAYRHAKDRDALNRIKVYEKTERGFLTPKIPLIPNLKSLPRMETGLSGFKIPKFPRIPNMSRIKTKRRKKKR